MRAAPGFLTEREGRFLALIAACAPAQGTILEIGSYKGKSTVGLASIAQRYGLGPVVAVDPHSAPAVTDYGHGTAQSSWDDFRATLRGAGVEGSVEAHRAYSRDLARAWDVNDLKPHFVSNALSQVDFRQAQQSFNPLRPLGALRNIE